MNAFRAHYEPIPHIRAAQFDALRDANKRDQSTGENGAASLKDIERNILENPEITAFFSQITPEMNKQIQGTYPENAAIIRLFQGAQKKRINPSERELWNKQANGLMQWQKIKNDDAAAERKTIEIINNMMQAACEIAGNRKYKHPLDHFLLKTTGIKTKQWDEIYKAITPLAEAFVQMAGAEEPPENPFNPHAEFDHNVQAHFYEAIIAEFGWRNSGISQIEIEYGKNPMCLPFSTWAKIQLNTYDIVTNIKMLFHEFGHGILECAKNIPIDIGNRQIHAYMLPWLSITLHEFMAKITEGMARSPACYDLIFPVLKKYFPESLKEHADAHMLYRWCNRYRPSQVRVECDMVGALLHNAFKHKIEKGALDGTLCARKWPQKFKEHMRRSLKIAELSDAPARGAFQDQHIFMDLCGFGFFNTYTLADMIACTALEKGNTGLFQGMDWEECLRHGQGHKLIERMQEVGKFMRAGLYPILKHDRLPIADIIGDGTEISPLPLQNEIQRLAASVYGNPLLPITRNMPTYPTAHYV
jgi:Zn-dependent M32 family carboxypeptidase